MNDLTGFRRNAGTMYYGRLTAILATVLCCACWRDADVRDTPHGHLERFTAIIEARDTQRFVEWLSGDTVKEVAMGQANGYEFTSEEFAEFIIERLRHEIPLSFVKSGGDADMQRIVFSGRHVRGELKLVREDGILKVDLTEAARYWKRIATWARFVAERASRGPVLGGQEEALKLPNMESLTQSEMEEAVLYAFGPYIPGLTEDARERNAD